MTDASAAPERAASERVASIPPTARATDRDPAPPFVLVDGSSYLFRAYHALPKLTAPDGHPTGAMLGVMNMLERLRQAERPSHMAVVFDAPGKTFRDDLYPEYKATRAETPDEIRQQIEPLHALVRALGYPLVCVAGVEADDVIATLATRAAAAGQSVLISTGDKDLAQLVDERITLVNTMTDTRLDRAGVIAKFGVPPERIVDYLALIGDSVDNIPGVEKVGPKTAAKWLAEFGDLDAIMARADEFPGKVGDNLRRALGHLPLARELVTVRRDCTLDVEWSTLTLAPPDTPTLRRMAQRYGFNRLLRSLEESVAPPSADAGEGAAAVADTGDAARHARALDVRIVDSEAALDALLAALDAAKAAGECVAFDSETTSLDPMRARLVGLSFAVDDEGGWYVPLAHVVRRDRTAEGGGAPAGGGLDDAEAAARTPGNAPSDALARLAPWLADAAAPKLGHHLKYDRSVLLENGLPFDGIAADTLLESYLLDAAGHRHDLDSLAERYLGWRTIHYEDLCGRGAKQIPFAEVPIDQAARYAVEDAVVTRRLHARLAPRLAEQPGPQSVYESIERPLIPVLGDMERAGVRIDPDELARQGDALRRRLEQVEAQAFEAAGESFNLGSPKQIQEILFERLGLPVLRKTPKGQPSTAEDVLEQMAAEHPLPGLILEHRSLAKLISTYIDKLPTLIHPRTGRVHTSFQQAVAATGRLSSTDPNLQNIPIRTDDGRRIRRAFVAEPGHLLLSADYSQIELRLMAHFSQDEKLLEAFRAGRDIHRATAAEVFGKALDDVSDADRRAAKAVNFGLIYGISAFGLARNLGIDQREARAIMDRYFARYAGVARYMEQARERGRKQGYVETLFGRRLALPDIDARNPARRAAAERVAINAPLQGTAADIIKRAMVRVHAGLARVSEGARMILQVHDELVFEVPEADIDAVRDFVVTTMQEAAELDVALIVETGAGPNWEAAH